MKFIEFKRTKRSYLLLTLFALLFSLNIQAQKINVQGVVTGKDDGAPIPGVTVLIQGTTNGTTTDFDGNYLLSAKIGDVLEFSFLGMETKALKVKGKTMNVALVADVQGLEEVVVIGYGTVKKKELTGAVTQVKSEDLERIVSQDLGSVLQGQASGVSIVSATEPGGDSEILIRGITTLGDNTPLFVVDGVIQEGDPRIAPSDIETIDILKDAASTAIYGSRGATGVILITTKQGKAGSLQVRSTASYAIETRNATLPLMNSTEQLFFNIVAQQNVTGVADGDQTLQIERLPYSFQNETDLNKLVFRDNVPTINFNTNISGGTEDITYNVSVGLFDQKGLMINSGYERFNTRANTVYKKNKLRIQTSAGLSSDHRDVSPNYLLGQTIRYYPYQPGIDLGEFDLLESAGDESNRLGWVINSLRSTQYTKTTRGNASFKIDYELFDGFKLTGNAGLVFTNTYGKRVVPYQELKNYQTGQIFSNPSQSYVRMDSGYRKALNFEVGATYQKKIGDHKLTGTVFATSERYEYDTYFARRAGATNPDITVLDGATLESEVGSGFNYIDKLIGVIGRVQYDYKGKYLFSSSVRRDGSSKFPEGNKWGMFPSVAFAWNVSDEGFWEPLKSTINNFKFRASRGEVGNQRIRSYLYAPSITQNVDYLSVDENGNEQLSLGAIQTTYSNELLKWETTTQTNIGVDLGLFKNKLTISAEYYNTDKKDMLFPVVLSPSAGGGDNAQVTLNVGNMVNKGFELSMRHQNRIGKFWYRMDGTFTTNKNEITKIKGQSNYLLTSDWGLVNGARDQSQITALAVGREAGAFFLWQTDGIINTDEKLAAYQEIVPSAQMGDAMYKDVNNDKKLNGEDRVYSGSGLPKFEVGYTLSTAYKNFDFQMNWFAAVGQEIMNGSRATAFAYGRHKDLIYQWSEDNQDTTIPAYRGDIKKHPNYIGYSDRWMEDGSYIRLKAITLGYKLPKEKLEKIGFSSLRVYVRAQNPLTITKYKGYNPEIGGGITGRGLDRGVGPTSKQYVVGLNFNF
ncbi:TonB-linked outer membrane protein, SusC/RagA family [Lutibacter oricola]|uniref:TonB-linked outer membrane protein, SusC/RagA family n=1 Tax=Lutibacter oricola TaxID=762486 RepID=A0A1H3BP74_9FLAO|nr:TonB-dependent receptor [Lutibacter oricola]SDX42949.1 TonB-linked outer membrane protein, SusC/RagA family [Lutibacter oricola]